MFGGRGAQNNNRGPAKTPARDSKPVPTKNKTTPGKSPVQANEQKSGSRARSRSPIDKNKNATSNNVEEKPDETKGEEKIYRYTGRPGEKKFNGRCRLFVANLGNGTTEDELREMFNEFGETGEVYVNKEKGFGFIRLDYRHNTEIAKLSLDKKLVKGRNIKVAYATHASAIELHGLDNFASNTFIEKAMSTFGAVERCIVVCDDRGRSKGYAIVEFEWKKSAAKVLDRLKDEMFVLGRLPKPVFAKPFILTDEEEGVEEETLGRLEGYETERACEPRFVSPNSFEYTWAKRWRDLFIEEQDKKARLEQEMVDARCKLEFEMEAAIRQNDAGKIREELQRRQEELRMLEEDMIRRQEADMRILERSRQRELVARQGHPDSLPRENMNERQGMMGPGGFSQQRGGGGPQQNFPGGYGGPSGGQQGGPRPQQYPGMDFRNQQQRGHPGEMQQREMQQRETQQREMQQRGMQPRGVQGRDVPQRDLPPIRDMPARELAQDSNAKDKSVEEKKN